MSPFAMSTATRNNAQSFSYFIPEQPFLETFMLLSYGNQDYKFMGDYIISVLKQQTRLLLRLHRSESCSDNQPVQLCLSIWKTFIPQSKIYRTINYWPNAKCLLKPFIPVFLLTTTTSTKANSQLKSLLNF